MLMHRTPPSALFARGTAWTALPALALLGLSIYWIVGTGRPSLPLPVVASTPHAEDSRHPVPDGRLSVGLLSLSGGDALGIQSNSAARISDPETGAKLKSVSPNAPVRVMADYAAGQVLMKGKGLWI